MERQQDVLDFWFGLAPEQYWTVDPALDEAIRTRFLDLWEDQRGRPAASFLGSADEALAAIVLFDQFPRNMFRGDPRSFATDALALSVAKGAIAAGYDRAFARPRRGFLYMPFQHSEALPDQDRSLVLFAELDDPNQLAFARKHHDVIARFGRFPHRNAVLGRVSTPEEASAPDADPTKL